MTQKLLKLFRISVLALATFYFFALGVSWASAAELSFRSDNIFVRPGETINISVIVDTGGESDNAFSGEVIFPQDFELEEIDHNNSIVTSWVVEPKVNGNSIQFAGVTFGGFSGVRDPFSGGNLPGTLFNFRISSETEGEGKIIFDRVKVLKNDGLASIDYVAIKPLYITVTDNFNSEELSIDRTSTDTVPPESFIPKIGSSSNVFDGQYFLAFDTIDTDSKVDRYFVREGLGLWTPATSPYLLRDQRLQSRISIKAVDAYGNIRVEYLGATHFNGLDYGLMLTGVIIGIAVLVWIYRKLTKRR